jgi:hypothetical protein
MQRFGYAAVAVAMLATSVPAAADDVTDQINQALEAYQKQNLSAAVAALDTAAGLIRQKKTEAWKTALPAPLSGWTADKAQGSALAPALLGGATTVSRVYRKAGDTITISIIADSPIVATIAAFLANSVVGLIGNSEIAVINGRRALYSKDENSFQTLVGDKVLVKVEGSHGIDDPVLREWFQAIDYAQLEKLAK